MALSENVNHLVYTVDNDLISISALNTDDSEAIESTVPLKTMGPFACSKTSSLPNVIAVNSPWWDENRSRGKGESNRKPRWIRLGNASVKIQ